MMLGDAYGHRRHTCTLGREDYRTLGREDYRRATKLL
jgi:hypothetical protein